jgi:DNA repair protein RecO (recombination protein O)
MQRIELEPAFVIHQRPYRNTSLLLELFTQNCGRVCVVARSARGPKSYYKGRLQLFTPLLATWYGRHELKTLTQVDWPSMSLQLEGAALLCGFYLNELLMRLLEREDAYPQLFQHYQTAIEELQQGLHPSKILRFFEKKLLQELGYGLPLSYEATTHQEILAEKKYRFVPDRGFFATEEKIGNDVFSGNCLIHLKHEHLDDADILKESKRLMRIAIAFLLRGKEINSRELFA